jgi:predicted helicase
MSLQLIQQYHRKLEQLVQYGGSRNETSIRSAFQGLLEQYASNKNLVLVTELEYQTSKGTTVKPDGTLKNAVRQDLGYWESKDGKDDLDEEIAKKFAKGYPKSNILFEDSQTVALIQNGKEVTRVEVSDYQAFNTLLNQFVGYEPKAVRDFRDAVSQFQEDLPDLLNELREVIELEATKNAAFTEKRDRLLGIAQKAINPHLVAADIREMIIQHILTEEIFINVFNDSQFHRENNIAHELDTVTQTFFKGALKKNTLNKIDPYYAVIRGTAADITDHHEKQKFLKVIYENFYKAYSPASADRLGIVYTPNEIVRFMIEATDHLTEKHFGKLLQDKDVNILDPATGTGTFVTELIEYLPKNKLKYKYQHEIFCNEVALLPYYTANLNIEYTYQQKMGEYQEFTNIAFVDTLDNLNYVGSTGQFGMFEMTAENLERIKRQNEKKISVIIGNPPYNALQMSENENNKNRLYPSVDARIKATYGKHSSAQNKNKLYDMYSRFVRWASDRISENGIIAFIINRSFIDSRTYDGFRKVVEEEFHKIYVVDLGGDVRVNPKLSGTTHNVFGIQTGVAILFLIRKNADKSRGKIYYFRRPETETAKEKLTFLRQQSFSSLHFETVVVDNKHYWLDAGKNDWESFLPLATKEEDQRDVIFQLFSLGIQTNRDEWVYDSDKKALEKRMRYFLSIYNSDVRKLYGQADKVTIDNSVNYEIKWSSSLKNYLLQGKTFEFNIEQIIDALYRPFIKLGLYFGDGVIHRPTHASEIFPTNSATNMVINFMGIGSPKAFTVLATDIITDLNFLSPAANGSRLLPLYRYDKQGNRLDNITNWGLKQFQEHYKNQQISKEDIFHYVYAVLHDPAYRKKYELNLKREFPRVPFYDSFSQWATWGKQLVELHLNYETVEPFGLTRTDTKVANPKAKLKADKPKGQIELDAQTTLSGIPAEAWEYKLGNRSALEWVLDRYKERKPKDPTIREKFNTYKFADYKGQVIDLLKRVCTVSVETMQIIREMEKVT